MHQLRRQAQNEINGNSRATWCDIDGDIADQTDLAAALAALGAGDPPRTITASDNALVTDTVIFVDSALGAVILSLPSAASFADKRLTVVHTVPDNLLTISPDGAETVNGYDDAQIAGDGINRSLELISNGTAWFIV